MSNTIKKIANHKAVNGLMDRATTLNGAFKAVRAGTQAWPLRTSIGWKSSRTTAWISGKTCLAAIDIGEEVNPWWMTP